MPDENFGRSEYSEGHPWFQPFREWREYFDHRFNHLNRLVETAMSNLDNALVDLTAIVKQASDDQAASSLAIQNELSALAASIGSGSTAADSAAASIEAIVASLKANDEKQQADTAALVASLPAVVVAPPAPSDPPVPTDPVSPSDPTPSQPVFLAQGGTSDPGAGSTDPSASA